MVRVIEKYDIKSLTKDNILTMLQNNEIPPFTQEEKMRSDNLFNSLTEYFDKCKNGQLDTEDTYVLDIKDFPVNGWGELDIHITKHCFCEVKRKYDPRTRTSTQTKGKRIPRTIYYSADIDGDAVDYDHIIYKTADEAFHSLMELLSWRYNN